MNGPKYDQFPPSPGTYGVQVRYLPGEKISFLQVLKSVELRALKTHAHCKEVTLGGSRALKIYVHCACTAITSGSNRNHGVLHDPLGHTSTDARSVRMMLRPVSERSRTKARY